MLSFGYFGNGLIKYFLVNFGRFRSVVCNDFIGMNLLKFV